jgi:hypothetical protein
MPATPSIHWNVISKLQVVTRDRAQSSTEDGWRPPGMTRIYADIAHIDIGGCPYPLREIPTYARSRPNRKPQKAPLLGSQ